MKKETEFMSVNFLISQAKNIQKVIDENAPEIEALDKILEMVITYLIFKEVLN